MYQPIANSGQNANNVMKRYGNDVMCCDSYPTACQYDITIATAATVNNIKFKRTAEGDTITKTFTAVGGTAVVAAIKAALVAEGYEEDSDEVTGVTSAVVSSNTIYSITGSLIVVSMTHTTSTVVTPTTKCDRTGICDHYITTAGGAANVFGVDGTDEDLGSLVIGTDAAAAVKAAIEGAIRQCAPATRQKDEGRDWNDYAQRTARYAYSAAGDRQAAELGKYRQQWEKLEGREPVRQQEQAKAQKIERDNSPGMSR